MRAYFVAGWLCVAALGLAVGARAQSLLPPPNSASVVDEIHRDIAKLVPGPRGQFTVDRAHAARDAILHHDFKMAKTIVDDVLAHSTLALYHFGPFSVFVPALVLTDNADFRAGLDAWVAESSDDAMPRLLRAFYFHETAWARRGFAYFNKLSQAQIEGFRDNAARAREDIDAVLRMRDDVPYVYWVYLHIVSAHPNYDSELDDAFAKAIAKFPTYYPLYGYRLDMLEPKWGGSVGAMYAFVEKYAGAAPDESPLRMLYIAEYRQALLNLRRPLHQRA